MGMISRTLAFVGVILLIVIGVVLTRTLTYGPQGAGGTAAITLPLPPTVYGEEIADRAAQALRFRTITVTRGDPRPGTEQPWLDLHDWLEATYPGVAREMTREIVPGTLTLLYTWPGSDPSLPPILLMAHQDVVPVNIGTEDDWTAPPFAGEIRDGYLYGRGTIDNKVSLVALMEASEALIEEGFMPRRTILIMFGHDEEVEGSGAAAGIALLKSRGIAPEMVLDEGFMVIDPFPLTGKPMGLIGVAEKGYLTLNVVADAAGGHSSTPPRDSATVRLSRAIVALDENQMPSDFSNPIVSGMFRGASADLPFATRMAMANLWLFRPLVEGQMAAMPEANAMIRTTTAPTMLYGSAKENVLAQQASAVVNFRIHPTDTPEDVVSHVEKLIAPIGGLRVELPETGIAGTAASPVSPTDNRAWAVLSAVAARTGGGAPVSPGLVLGATDARYAAAISSSVYRFSPAVLSPDELRGFHGTNERISIANIQRMVEGYALIIMVMSGD